MLVAAAASAASRSLLLLAERQVTLQGWELVIGATLAATLVSVVAFAWIPTAFRSGRLPPDPIFPWPLVAVGGAWLSGLLILTVAGYGVFRLTNPVFSAAALLPGPVLSPARAVALATRAVQTAGLIACGMALASFVFAAYAVHMLHRLRVPSADVDPTDRTGWFVLLVASGAGGAAYLLYGLSWLVNPLWHALALVSRA